MTTDRPSARNQLHPGASVVSVVSGSYGAGHDAAADALTAQLTSAGYVVHRLDVADELAWGSGRLLRRLYFAQLRLLPASWGTTLRLLEQDGVLTRVACRILSLLGRRLVRRVAGAQLVISTHPFASQVLGHARTRGALSTPVVTYLTDASVHRLWVHPSVDLHLAMHELSAGQARLLGGRTRVIAPAVARRGARSRGWRPPWPASAPTALIVGGSGGIGELEATALDVLATGLMTPVVACGHNERLRKRLAARPGVLALGWRDDLADLMAQTDCVLQNAGGMTSLEALAAGTPTFTYRPIPGHGITNAEVLQDAGLVRWLRNPAVLGASLAEVLRSARPAAVGCGDPGVVHVLRGAGVLGIPTPALDLVA